MPVAQLTCTDTVGYMADENVPRPVIAGALGATFQGAEAKLPAALERMQRKFNRLVAAYTAGEIDRRQLKLALAKLVAVDTTGTAWSIGATSGRFHALRDGNWVVADPSGALFDEE